MTQKQTGGPAFPGVTENDTGEGMTLRDYFAGQALAGLCSDGSAGTYMSRNQVAEACYRMGDAMIAARDAE